MSYLESMAGAIYSVLSSLSDEVWDLIPSDFDFKNKVAVEYKIGESVLDQEYKINYTLQIRVVGNNNNKLYEILGLSEEIDKLMNKAEILESRITREKPHMTSYIDEDKKNVVLQYLINRY